MGPSLQNSGQNSRFCRILEQINLALWNDLILMCVPRNLKLSVETRGFRKIRPGRNRNKQRNTQPRLPAIDWLPRHIESILKRALNCSFLPQLVANKGRGHGHGPLPPPQKKRFAGAAHVQDCTRHNYTPACAKPKCTCCAQGSV